VIHHTTNGGQNWIWQYCSTNVDLFSVYFIDASLGWVVGNNGTILSTKNGGVSFVEEEQIDEIPTEFFLMQNYPNPFNPSTKISWQSPIGSWQTLKIYDVLGNEVATLVDEYKPAGSYEVDFNVTQVSRPKISSGIYFYQLTATPNGGQTGDPSTGSGQGFIQTKKMILIK